MQTMNKVKKSLAGLAVSSLALGAGAGVTVTTNDTVVTVTGSGELYEAFLAPDVTSVVFDMSGALKYFPSVASTYAGGTTIKSNQFYVNRNDALGSGPVAVGTADDASLMVRDCEVVIPNKVVFPRSNSYAVGFGDSVGRLTLKSVGTAGSQYHTVRLGRIYQGDVGRVTLSLTDADSEPVSQYIFQGALKMTLDGGTIKARSDAKAPFFSQATDPADITVTLNGVAFDSPASTQLKPGQPMKFLSAILTNVVETCAPANPGFEQGKTAWTFTKMPGGENDSDVKTTPCAWDGNGAYPPIGSKYAMVRQGVKLSTTVDVPSDGLWRIVFYRGGRPEGYSVDISLDVALDDATTHYPTVSELSFTQYKTPPVAIKAGSHTISFTTSNGGTGHSLNIDEVGLERVEIVDTCGTLGKTGAGSLVLAGQSLAKVPVNVTAGTLDLTDCTLSSATVAVAKDATLRLRDLDVAQDARLDIASGAQLTITGFVDENLVANGNFEADGVQDYSSGIHPKNWTFRQDGANDGWGLQKNGGTLSPTGPTSPDGSCTVYLREKETIYQTVSVSEAGTYRLSFLAADRKFGTSNKVPFWASVDDVKKLEVVARASYADYTSYTVNVELQAGDHTIAFSTGINGNGTLGNIVFFDDVRLMRICSELPKIAGRVDLVSGSVLNLDYDGKCEIPVLYVDGKQIVGGPAALTKAGVTVVGTGNVKVGPDKGLIVVVR